MALTLENGYVSLNKCGEQLCGDKVECIREGEWTTLVLADGLGSGVKANILATLTSKILCTMVASGISLEECVETIIKSLPVCKVRKVAYSTFSIIHMNAEGRGYLVEFDNPQAIYLHGGKSTPLSREKLTVQEKTIYRTTLNLEEGDVIVVFSDGVVHAGIGTLLNFGWDRPEIEAYLSEVYRPGYSARATAALLAAACRDLYMDKPGDDTTIAAVKVRAVSPVSVMVGPPVDKSQDDFAVSTFLGKPGKKAVCGGTSSQLVARHLGKPLTTSLDFVDKDIPPVGHIEGIDLTTEGVITLRRLVELSEHYIDVHDTSPKYFSAKDGASLLADLLFEDATDITFYVGRSVNVAHQGLPIDTSMKLKLVEKLADNLRAAGKNVELNYY